MKQAILNLYQRQYLTFYVLVFFADLIISFVTKIPILTLLIIATIFTLSAVDLLKKFKK